MADFELFDHNADLIPHHCTNCMNAIKDTLFLCVSCLDYKLCMQCYVCGAVVGTHKRTHAFKMIDLGTFTIFGKRMKNEKAGDSTQRCLEEACDMYVSCDENDNDEDCHKFEPRKTGRKDEEEEDEIEPRKVRRKEKATAAKKPFDVKKYWASKKKLSESERKKLIVAARKNLPKYTLENGILVMVPKGKKKDDSDGPKPARVWRALDELELLDAMSRLGYGNWKAVSQVLSKTMKDISPEEVADHYAIHYILCDIGDYTWDWKLDASRIVDLFTISQERMLFRQEDQFDDLPQAELDSLGFMPRRDDFEREFDNEAESLIANLTVGKGEDEIETKFKMAQVQMYKQRVAERFRKKAIVRRYGLVRKFLQANQVQEEGKNGALASSSSAAASSLSNSSNVHENSVITPFLHFAPQDSLKSLYLDLQKEMYLKLAIRKLLKYQRLGMSKCSEIKEFEERRKTRTSSEGEPMEMDDVKEDSSAEASSDDEFSVSLKDSHLWKILAPISDEGLKEILCALLEPDTSKPGSIKGEIKEQVKEEEDNEEEEESSQLGISKKARLRSHRLDQLEYVVSPRSCRQLSAEEKKLCSQMKLQPSVFLELKQLTAKEVNSKSLTRGRRFSFPFVYLNEPASLQAILQAAFGANATIDEIDTVMNKVVPFLLKSGIKTV